MNVFSRLSIGTANFGQEYNGCKVPEKEVEKILAYAWDNGIRSLDCAKAYNWDWWEHCWREWQVTWKVKAKDEFPECDTYCIMAHGSDVYQYVHCKCCVRGRGEKKGVSGYDALKTYYNTAEEAQVVQLPYSIYDRRCEDVLPRFTARNIEVQVRSIFLRGKIYDRLKNEVTRPAQHCMIFPLLNPNVDKVIIGVESLDQLKQNLEYFQWLDGMKCDDENIIDPRRWEQK